MRYVRISSRIVFSLPAYCRNVPMKPELNVLMICLLPLVR